MTQHTKKLKDDDVLSVENVDLFIQNAVSKYFDSGKFLEGLFWKECMRLLQQKYGFTLGEVE